MHLPPIRTASIDWDAQGAPASRHFGDIYFSPQNGMQETEYVFLAGNALPARFATHPRPLFCVAETGFGTGLNFLMLWQAFRQFRAQHPDATVQRLHLISVEQFPLTLADLEKAQHQWPPLAELADELRRHWPPALAGCHRLVLDQGRVTLDLWLGDLNTVFPTLDDSLTQQVDAWFLDGFAPAKNPQMWSETLWQTMARLTRPGGTFATFTAAGTVRRALEAHGFRVHKRKGFGRKREMLCGEALPQAPQPSRTPWYHRPAASSTADIALIGGGIASATTALALLRRGAGVTLYCADSEAAQQASGNRQGALYPALNGGDTALSRFFSAAFLYARQFLRDLEQQSALQYAHDWCGVSLLACTERQRQKLARLQQFAWPAEFLRAVDAAELDQLTGVACGVDGMTFPAGGWLCPAELTCALMALAQQRGLRLRYQYDVTALQPTPDGWQLDFAQQPSVRHAVVILANGHRITDFTPTASLPLTPVRGQVSHIATTPALRDLRQVLCYDGYLTPMDPARQQHCLGATHQRNDRGCDYREADQQANFDRLLNALPDAAWPRTISLANHDARSSIRCAVRDHLPLVGAVPDEAATRHHYARLGRAQSAPETVPAAPVWRDLFMIGALGSRGLCSAPLAGEVLAAQMFGEPLPLDRETLAALNPNRLQIRALLKRR